MELPVEWHQETTKDEHCQVPLGATEGILVTEVRNSVGGTAVNVDALPDCILDHSQEGIPCIVQHLSHPVTPVWQKWPFGPSKPIQGTVPETKEPKCYQKVCSEPVIDPVKVVKPSGSL